MPRIARIFTVGVPKSTGRGLLSRTRGSWRPPFYPHVYRFRLSECHFLFRQFCKGDQWVGVEVTIATERDRA